MNIKKFLKDVKTKSTIIIVALYCLYVLIAVCGFLWSENGGTIITIACILAVINVGIMIIIQRKKGEENNGR